MKVFRKRFEKQFCTAKSIFKTTVNKNLHKHQTLPINVTKKDPDCFQKMKIDNDSLITTPPPVHNLGNFSEPLPKNLNHDLKTLNVQAHGS